MAFTPKFVDLVRNTTTTTGTGNFVLGPAVNGYTGFAQACAVGDTFYYSCIGVDKPAEREVGRGTLLAGGAISRDAVSGTNTNFTSGTKTIALIAAAEWFSGVQAGAGAGSAPAIAATRAALAGLSDLQKPALLCEARREGLFLWDPSNMSAKVAADPQQGIYIPSGSDPTGASGAWVRKFSGPKDARWFGATGDGATDDHNALQAWLDSGGHLHLPASEYYSSAKLIVRKNIRLEGSAYGFDARIVDGTSTVGYENQPGAKIKFPAGVGGLDFQPQTTVTDVTAAVAAGVAGYTQEGAAHSIVQDLGLVGAGTGAAATGVYARVVVHLENVHVLKFQGKGFDLSASSSAPDGNSEYGSLNGATLRNCRAIYNGSHGFHIRGSDANACTFINCTAQLNGGWGFLDESALGNTYVGGEAATNSSGAYKCIGGVADSTYIGCYAEVGTGQAPDLSYRCVVNGGYLADHANQYNVGTNGNPTVLFAGGTQTPQLNFTTGQNEAVASAAGNAKLFRGADKGLILQGAPNVGGTFDVSILNKNAGQVMSVSTGTTQARFFGEVAVDFNGYFLNGPSAWAGAFGSNGSARMFATAAGGLQLYGQGSSYDVSVGNKVGGVALRVPTNTTNVEIVGTVSASNLSGTNSGDQFTSIAQNTVLGRTAAGPGAASALTTIPTAALPAMAGGDVTSAAGSTTLTIGAGAVSYSKIQNVSPARLIGNPSGTAAAPAEISLAGGLAFSGTTLTAAGALTPTSLASTGTVTTSGGAMGYATGAGGTVTQLTSKSTAVTVNKVSGQVTTHNASMAAAALVSFTVNNSAVAATDTINLNLASGNATAGTYRYWVEGIAAGVFKIVIENRSAGALAETLVFNFALLKAVNA